MIKNLNIRPDSIKFLEKNVEQRLFDIGLGNNCFGYDTKSKNKSKNLVGLHQTHLGTY